MRPSMWFLGAYASFQTSSEDKAIEQYSISTLKPCPALSNINHNPSYSAFPKVPNILLVKDGFNIQYEECVFKHSLSPMQYSQLDGPTLAFLKRIVGGESPKTCPDPTIYAKERSNSKEKATGRAYLHSEKLSVTLECYFADAELIFESSLRDSKSPEHSWYKILSQWGSLITLEWVGLYNCCLLSRWKNAFLLGLSVVNIDALRSFWKLSPSSRMLWNEYDVKNGSAIVVFSEGIVVVKVSVGAGKRETPIQQAMWLPFPKHNDFDTWSSEMKEMLSRLVVILAPALTLQNGKPISAIKSANIVHIHEDLVYIECVGEDAVPLVKYVLRKSDPQSPYNREFHPLGPSIQVDVEPVTAQIQNLGNIMHAFCGSVVAGAEKISQLILKDFPSAWDVRPRGNHYAHRLSILETQFPDEMDGTSILGYPSNLLNRLSEKLVKTDSWRNHIINKFMNYGIKVVDPQKVAKKRSSGRRVSFPGAVDPNTYDV